MHLALSVTYLPARTITIKGFLLEIQDYTQTLIRIRKPELVSRSVRGRLQPRYKLLYFHRECAGPDFVILLETSSITVSSVLMLLKKRNWCEVTRLT